MIFKRKIKKVLKKVTEKQKIARSRNWAKGIITGIIKQLENPTFRKGLTKEEKIKLQYVSTYLENILNDWRSTK